MKIAFDLGSVFLFEDSFEVEFINGFLIGNVDYLFRDHCNCVGVLVRIVLDQVF